MTSVHTFQNGFRVIYQSSEHAIPISSVYLFCGVGSAYETDTVRGASHFVEHMCFKGTEKIKKARNLLLQYNKSGTAFNAFTDKWITGYLFKCDDDTLGYLTTVLSDMVLHYTFPKKEFNKEQHIVVEECLRAQDNPPNLLEDEMERVLCSGSSYEYPVDEIAYHPTATHLTYERMTEWYHAFYQPSNFVLSVVSSLSFSTILAMIRKTDLVKKEGVPRSFPPYALPSPRLSLLPISSGPLRIEYYPKKGITTTFMDIAFRTCPHSSPDKHKLTLLTYIMNGFSGRLFTALRTDKGLTYRSNCKTVHLEHTGYFKIHVQTNPHKLLSSRSHDGVLPILIELLMDLRRNGIHPEELQMIKGHIKGNLLLGMESIDALAQFNGIEYLLSTDESFVPYKNQYTAYFARMTKKQVDEVIRRYFTRENLVIGIMYDHELPKKKIQSVCESFH
jgi:predicted Zn-dependent peptidase